MKKNMTDSEAVIFKAQIEREQLRRFASKITKIPESVRVYSDVNMEKKK